MHQPVLLKQFLEFSSGKSATSSLWDGTLGAAGHLLAWMQNNPAGMAYGSDQDADMIEIARKAIDGASSTSGNPFLDVSRIKLTHANYSENPFKEFAPFDIIFLDLGISSWHLDFLNRGISYRDTGLLDMRLDTSSGTALYKWLMNASFEDIRNVIYKYGEESYAPVIARKIIEQRNHENLTPDWLNKICIQSYGRSSAKYTKTPGVKTFQAFRIYINQELDHLEKALKFMPSLLKPFGKLIIISFHSLEDRIVKHFYKSCEKIKNDSVFAKSEYRDGDFRILTKKPVVPDDEEIRLNPRSRSAKMRVLQKIR